MSEKTQDDTYNQVDLWTKLLDPINNASLISTVSYNFGFQKTQNVAKDQSALRPHHEVDLGVYDRSRMIPATLSEMYSMQNSSINNDKSILFSVLVNKYQIDTVTNSLIQLGKQISQNSTYLTKKWHVKLLKTNLNEFTLINLFMTTNEYPQIIFLGYDIACFLYGYLQNTRSYRNYKLIFKPLCKCKYLWHTSNPSEFYKANLVSLDDAYDWTHLSEIINSQFDIFLNFILSKKYNYKQMISEVNAMGQISSIKSIKILDLCWFITYLKNYAWYSFNDAYANDDIKEDMQKMINYLADKIET